MEQQNEQGKTIPIQEVLQMQFAKVGKLSFELDIVHQQLIAFEQENIKLREEKKELEKRVLQFEDKYGTNPTNEVIDG